MPLPTPQEYAEAVQNPALNFNDRDLRQGTLTTNRLGLPMAMSGAYATVFRVQSANRSWAVKCFTRSNPDTQQRYESISKYISPLSLPFTVGFEYLPQGILVSSQWYPVLKMEWVSGLSLSQSIEASLLDSQTLRSMANKWTHLNQVMQRHHFAHGDLQHGNIIVVNGEFKLIDYDDMFVPSLQGRKSNVIGELNYQHPKRTLDQYDESTDRFSAWVIYCSLLALSYDSSLWQSTQAGEANGHLIFTKDDYATPYASNIFATLAANPEPRLQQISAFMKRISSCDILDVPAFDPSALFPSGQQRLPTQSPSPAPEWVSTLINFQTPPATSSPPSTPGASWVATHLNTTQRPSVTLPAPSTGSSWIIDHLDPQPSPHISQFREFATSDHRIITRLYPISALAIPLVVNCIAASYNLAIILFAELLLLLIASATCIVRFHRMLPVRAMRQVRKSERKCEAAYRTSKSAFEMVQAQYAAAAKGKQQAIKSLLAQKDQVETAAQKAVKSISSMRDRELYQLERTRGTLAGEERQAIQQALQKYQEEQLRIRLSTLQLTPGEVPGIGPATVARLHAAGYGIYGRMDSQVRYVKGIGPQRAAQLLAWYNNKLNQIRAQLPTSLPHNEHVNIERIYIDKQNQIDESISRIKSSSAGQIVDVNTDRIQRLQWIDGEINRLNSEFAGTQQQWDDVLRPLQGVMAQREWELLQLKHQVDALRPISATNYLKLILLPRFVRTRMTA